MKNFLLSIVLLLLSPYTTFPQTLEDKVEGLLIGTVIGDAAGAPMEFQAIQRSFWATTDTVLSQEGIQALADSFKLVNSKQRGIEPYGLWIDQAEAGHITDDTRIKMIFFDALRKSSNPSKEDFIWAMVDFPERVSDKYKPHAEEWLQEFLYTAYWELGVRVVKKVYPADRIWAGIPTLLGHMTFTPLAAIKHEDPEWIYHKTWELDFFDTGFAKDIHGALIAGLGRALQEDGNWQNMEETMRATDPLNYNEVPWTPRRLELWLDSAHTAVEMSEGKVANLFDILETKMGVQQWWDAWYPMVVVFSCAEIAQYDLLASMQLTLEFGHDTDSYAQLMGAIIGAIHGKEVFPKAMRENVNQKLKEEYGESIEEWMQLLGYGKLEGEKKPDE